MTKRRSTPIGLTIAALCVAVTTACASVAGGASPQGPEAGSGAGNSSASPPIISPSVSAAPSTPTTSTATCTTAQLTVKTDGSAAAGGHAELIVEMTNQSTATCTLSGFPAVTGRLQSGTVVHGTDTTHVFIGMANPGNSPSPVTLTPGARAWLPLNFLDNPINGATSCPSFSSFAVTPPGGDQAYTVQAPDNPPDCDGIAVPPVLSAADAVIPSSS